MKKIIFPLAILATLFVCSCNTTKKLYQAQEYDQVIMNNAERICSGRLNNKLLTMVVESYHRANQADHERIQALKATGKPEVWPEVFERYCSMKGRNDALACLPRDLKKQINYVTLDLDDEIQSSRNKADAYLAAVITQQLGSNNPDLDQTDRMIRRLEGINRDNSRLNEFKLKSLARRYGDLSKMMHIDIRQHQVGANRDEAVSFKETKGNLTANVTDHVLSKSATIKGKVNFIDPRSKRLLLAMPFDVTSKFEHNYTVVEGPQEACSEQTLARLKQQPLPFPTDESMLKDAEKQLIEMINQKLQ